MLHNHVALVVFFVGFEVFDDMWVVTLSHNVDFSVELSKLFRVLVPDSNFFNCIFSHLVRIITLSFGLPNHTIRSFSQRVLVVHIVNCLHFIFTKFCFNIFSIRLIYASSARSLWLRTAKSHFILSCKFYLTNL